jgi:hypothetical protein
MQASRPKFDLIAESSRRGILISYGAFQSRGGHLRAGRKPARSALKANLGGKNVVTKSFLNEIFNQKTTERVELDDTERIWRSD